MSLKINSPFNTPANYEYDSNKIEIDNGKAKLKDITPLDSTFYSAFDTKDANWCNGDKVGTLNGGASVSGGQLDLAGYVADRYVEYSAINNADSKQQGCIRFRVTPNYSGAPEYTQHFFESTKYNRDGAIQIYHRTNNHIRWYIFGGDSLAISACLLSWSPIAGQEYEFELNYDIANGETRLFIDGIERGTMQVGTGTRNEALVLQSGRIFTSNWYRPNFYLNDLLIFSEPQHTANYIPDWSNIPDSKYSKDNPTIKPASHPHVEELNNIIETVEKAGSDDIKYTLLVNGVEKYWDGAAWVSGTGYNNANTITEINDNCSLIDFSLGFPLKFIAYLHSENGDTFPELDNLEVEFDFFGGLPEDTNRCIVFGFIYGTDSLPIENVVVRAKLKNVADYNDEIQMGQITHATKTNGYGYWELDLTETDSLEDNIKYNFEFLHPVYNLDTDKNVPDVETKNFVDLV